MTVCRVRTRRRKSTRTKILCNRFLCITCLNRSFRVRGPSRRPLLGLLNRITTLYLANNSFSNRKRIRLTSFLFRDRPTRRYISRTIRILQELLHLRNSTCWDNHRRRAYSLRGFLRVRVRLVIYGCIPFVIFELPSLCYDNTVASLRQYYGFSTIVLRAVYDTATATLRQRYGYYTILLRRFYDTATGDLRLFTMTVL